MAFSSSSKTSYGFSSPKFLKQMNNTSTEKTIFTVEGPCSKENCKSPYGECSNENTCRCNYGWAHNPKIKNNVESSCSYSLKNLKLFFIVEIFTVFGGGHLYAGRLLYGFIKLFSFLIVFILDLVFGRVFFYNRNKTPNTLNFVIYFLYLALILFHYVDLILISINYHLDGNGMPIQS